MQILAPFIHLLRYERSRVRRQVSKFAKKRAVYLVLENAFLDMLSWAGMTHRRVKV